MNNAMQKMRISRQLGWCAY